MKAQTAVQIVSVTADGELLLEKDALQRLLAPHLEKRLLIVSCVGALRGGKSTLLSWLVRTAQRNVKDPDAKQIFPTAWGRTPCTSGIWAQVVEREEDENSCWLFLDTQGMFDGNLDVTNSSHLFGLASLVSSLLIYNVSKRVGEDIISHAAHFATIARNARPLIGGEVRTLEFLVRDWEYFEYPEDIPEAALKDLAKSAANDYLNDHILGQKALAESNETRDTLKRCFSAITVALLPHPGRAVTRPEFEENQAEQMDDKFRMLFMDYCHSVIQRTSTSTSSSLTGDLNSLIYGRELVLILSEACEHFRERSPKLETLFVSTARASNIFAAEQARKLFDRLFVLDPERFQASFDRAVETFDSLARFGPEGLREEFREGLVAYAENVMARVSNLQRQVKLRRRRIKQVVVATSAGVVLAPVWMPSAVSFAVRSSIFAATSATSTAVNEVATAPVIFVFAALATTFLIVGSHAWSQTTDGSLVPKSWLWWRKASPKEHAE